MNAMVEPLPLVPATWMTGGSLRSGWPSAASSRHMRSSERSISLGCSASSRVDDGIDGRHVRGVYRDHRKRADDAHALGRRRQIIALRQRRRRRHARRLALRAGALVSSRQTFDERRAQLVAMHHHVDHAVLVQILRALEAFGQLLADGLLDDARTGEADQRARLGDVDVAQHGVGRGDAAGGRIGQHDDVGLAGLAQHLHRHRGARQLHQRQDAFLHARAAGRREHDERRALLDRGLEPLDDGLARRHAERAAHEIEILHRDHHRQAVELAVAELDRVGGAGLGARVLEAVGVAALVAELERIDRRRRAPRCRTRSRCRRSTSGARSRSCACGSSSPE